METIEQFREAITNLYNNLDKGISEEDEQLLNFLENSPDSLKFAIEEIGSESPTNFSVLFESTIIVSNFIVNSWESFDENQKGIIITVLLKYIKNSEVTNAAVNKSLVCLANIMTFEFSNFGQIFQEIPPQFQVDSIIILIEEMHDRKKNDLRYDQYLIEICPIVLQMLGSLPISIEFLKLSKAALLCFVSNVLYDPFMDKFEEALGDPSYFPYCTSIINTILLSSPVENDDPNLNFYFRIIKFSLALSFRIVQQKIFDIPCEIWCEVVDFAPFLFFDTEYTSFFISELLKFLTYIDISTPELLELVKRVCDVFADESFPTYEEVLFQLFNIILAITDVTWSNSLDLAVHDIYSKIPAAVTQIFIEKMENPTPGLFIIACQCQLSNEILSALSLRAIQMKDSIPPFHLLTFIWRIGKKFPEYKEQWLEILLKYFPCPTKIEVMSTNNLIFLLKTYPDLQKGIPEEFFTDYIQHLEPLGKSACELWIKGIQLFDVVKPSFLTTFLEKVHTFVLMLTQDVIVNEDFDDYFRFIRDLNQEITGRPNIDEFKKSIVESALNLLCQFFQTNPDDLKKNENAMKFLQKLSNELGIGTEQTTE